MRDALNPLLWAGLAVAGALEVLLVWSVERLPGWAQVVVYALPFVVIAAVIVALLVAQRHRRRRRQ